jgi:alkylation response protein AidB-like acyl-CoA dehydrogenase
MSFDPIAQSLALLNRFSQADWVHKLGIFEPAQKVAYVGAREGFKAAAAAARQFKSVQKLLKPERLPVQDKKADVFDLNPTEEQQMLRDMTQRFAREAMRPAAHDSDAKAAPVEGFDAQFAELGLAQFAVPEALGGAASEAWETTQCLAAEDLAHGDMGLAVRALAPVGVANALARWGTSEQQDKYLRAFASDKPPLASIAICERRVAFDPKELTTRALVNGEGYVLNGEKTLVPLADEAELYLVAAQLVGHGPCVFIVEANTPGLTRMHESTMGVRAARTGAIKLEDVKLPADALLGGELGVVNYEELVDRAQLAWCALAIGAGQAVLEYTIEYCNDRVAFGEPISNRQAVAFMIANIGIEVESMRLLTWRAAARAEAGLPFHREAYLAHLLCLEKGMEIGTNGVQLLGGHGFTKEHPVERWYRDLMALGVMEGGLCL